MENCLRNLFQHHYGVNCHMAEKRKPTYDLDAFKATDVVIEFLLLSFKEKDND